MENQTDNSNTIQKTLKEAQYTVKAIPWVILDILNEDKWRFRKSELSANNQYKSFPEFVQDAEPYGLGCDWNEIQRLIKGNAKVELAVAHALKGKRGGDRKSLRYVKDNSQKITGRKTKKQKDLEQLERYRPDLLNKVTNGELTVHRAMIEGGFRTERIVTPPEPNKIAEIIIEKFSKEERKHIAELLMASL